MGGTKDLRTIQNSVPCGGVQCSKPSVVSESQRNSLHCELEFGRSSGTHFGSFSKRQRRTDYRNQQSAASDSARSEVCVLAPMSILGIGAGSRTAPIVKRHPNPHFVIGFRQEEPTLRTPWRRPA